MLAQKKYCRLAGVAYCYPIIMRDGDFFLRIVLVWCLCIAAAVAQNPSLRVEYESSNYSEPILSCRDELLGLVDDATFFKGDEEINVQETNIAGRYRYVFAPGSGEAHFLCADDNRIII